MDGGHVDSTDGGSLCKENDMSFCKENEMSFLTDGGRVVDEVKAILAQLEK